MRGKIKQRTLEAGLNLAEHLPSGYELQWNVRKTLNHLRVGVERSKDNVSKLGYLNDQDTFYHFGTFQTMAHLLVCLLVPGP